jgi:hypothetical protein
MMSGCKLVRVSSDREWLSASDRRRFSLDCIGQWDLIGRNWPGYSVGIGQHPL